MAEKSIYTVGGTVQAGGGIYIKRQADDELLDLCRNGELAFILSSRQVGKSSLMVRTARQLECEGIRSVIIDLSGIGVTVSADEWYLGILSEIDNTLELKTDVFTWWAQNAQLGPTLRLTNFFRKVLLEEVEGRVVLFFDEIDSTLSLSFADDFFAALRAAYNARSVSAEFGRLSFVLVGVATPGDLISDSKRTPFNIGRRVELNDFTLEEALPLAQGLGGQPEQALGWVLAWTGGHPYLTQRLCAHFSQSREAPTEESVALAVERLFTGEQGQQDNNLQFVRDMLVRRAPDVRKVLTAYREIRAGRPVADDERSLPKSHLKISGLVRREDGRLALRNRIYASTFDPAWIKENMPPLLTRWQVVVMSLVILALFIVSYFGYQELMLTDTVRAARLEEDFAGAGDDPQVQLASLAGLFELEGDAYPAKAGSLFNSLPHERKLALFEPAGSRRVRADQVIVVQGLYQTLGFKTAPDEQADQLLASMSAAVQAPAPDLADEIAAWLKGRQSLNQQSYPRARDDLEDAIRLNENNPALYFERARAYLGMGEEYYPQALEDLTEVVQLEPNRSAAARRLVKSGETIKRYWAAHAEDYPALAEAVTIPMEQVPAGEFTMGSDADAALAECQKYRSDCQRDWFVAQEPVHTVYLDDFSIDVYEVTNALYAECVAEGVCAAPASADSATRTNYYNDPIYADYPVINVTWFDANTYCQWRGARLPSEAEWEKAARGVDARTYPWGEGLDCSRANYYDSSKNDYCVGDTTEVGRYESGVSPYGVYDLAGNVWEWVADWYAADYYAALGDGARNPQGPAGGDSRVLRGGAWNNSEYDVRSAYRFGVEPDLRFYYVGFRCALSP